MIRRLRYAWAFLFGSARWVEPVYHPRSRFAGLVGTPAVTIWRHVYFARGILPTGLVAHETEHVYQFGRLGVVRFLLLYWFLQLRDGYDLNRLEVEAQNAGRRAVRIKRRAGQ